MDVVALIERKRDGAELHASEIQQLIQAYAADQIPDYQMAAFAMATLCRGMNPLETTALTRAMRDSGEQLVWPSGSKPMVDKHSTGGIGDKVSLILAPLLAACGAAVPMISGRGLGATGGTLDKLESFTNFRSDLTTAALQSQVLEIGCAIVSATERLAPADRKLYALRDVTGTVPSIPLITASILAKKLAENLQGLVLDVKVGSGAFMKTLEQARELAGSLVKVATRLGVTTVAWITDMNQPLGSYVGNACEVIEAIEVLKGSRNDSTLTPLVLGLASEALCTAKLAATPAEALPIASRALSQGDAYESFARMIRAQGGNAEQKLELATEHVVTSPKTGWIEYINGETLGRLIIALGGGRKKVGDSIDHSVGLQMHAVLGAKVEKDQPLVTVYSGKPLSPEVLALAHAAFHLGPMPSAVGPLMIERIDSSSFPSGAAS